MCPVQSRPSGGSSHAGGETRSWFEPKTRLLQMLPQEVGDDLVCASGVLVEVEVVARVRVQIWYKRLGVSVKGAGGLVEDAVARAVTHNVIVTSCDGQGGAREPRCIQIAVVVLAGQDGQELGNGEDRLVLLHKVNGLHVVKRSLEVPARSDGLASVVFRPHMLGQ